MRIAYCSHSSWPHPAGDHRPRRLQPLHHGGPQARREQEPAPTLLRPRDRAQEQHPGDQLAQRQWGEPTVPLGPPPHRQVSSSGREEFKKTDTARNYGLVEYLNDPPYYDMTTYTYEAGVTQIMTQKDFCRFLGLTYLRLRLAKDHVVGKLRSATKRSASAMDTSM